MKELRPVSAHTKHPNTPETDKQLYVEHEVTLSDGTVRTVFATDPSDAINVVRRHLREENK
jgi:hypothetical protein